MIKPIPSKNTNEYYKDKYINRLVDLSLENIDTKFFLNILHLIQHRSLKHVNKKITMFKSRVDESIKSKYDELKYIFEKIYEDDSKKDNLRGTFLELIVYKFLYNKYSSIPGYISALDCYVEIFGNVSIRTVDVFAFCGNKGFVSENKISEVYFENHDIENLNRIYNDSNHYLKPYIITLAPQKYIENKLSIISSDDDVNVWVHWGDIKIVSIDNIASFFS